MTAAEARELATGSLKYKGLWYKVRLAWLCGRINKEIEFAAEAGQSLTSIQNIHKKTAQRYFLMLAKLYEAEGFFICYTIELDYYNSFYIVWDLSRMQRWWINSVYKESDYYTPIKETDTNESNSTSSRNWKN